MKFSMRLYMQIDYSKYYGFNRNREPSRIVHLLTSVNWVSGISSKIFTETGPLIWIVKLLN